MKKILLLSIILLSVMMTACKPDPINNEGDDNNDTIQEEEPIVKKYLVKQLLNDDPEKIMLSIDWNEDCSQIRNVKYSMGYGSTANYDFTYYNNDSIRIDISILDEFPNWTPYYNVLIIHLNNSHNIDKIYCYANNTLIDIERYIYDNEGKLLHRIYWDDMYKDDFQWNGENVVKSNINGVEYSYELTDYFHPHYMIPFYMSDQIFETGGRPLFTPLWKNMIKDNCIYEIDQDKYITKKIYKDNTTDTVRLFYSYYYTTSNK